MINETIEKVIEITLNVIVVASVVLLSILVGAGAVALIMRIIRL